MLLQLPFNYSFMDQVSSLIAFFSYILERRGQDIIAIRLAITFWISGLLGVLIKLIDPRMNSNNYLGRVYKVVVEIEETFLDYLFFGAI